MSCTHKVSGKRVLAKLMTPSQGAIAAQAWMQGSRLRHPNLVEYQGVYLHRDVFSDITQRLQSAFDAGLPGSRPTVFPAAYCCLVVEYMDRGTVHHLMER